MQLLVKFAAVLIITLSWNSVALAQIVSGTFTGIVTYSQINDHPFFIPPIIYNYDGQVITGTFQVDHAGGFTNASYAAILPTFAFGGYGSSSEDDLFDGAEFSSDGVTGSLIVYPDLIGIDSWAGFSIVFNLAALNNPHIPLSGSGNYNFYYNLGGSTGGDLDGVINFVVTGGTIEGAVPEPAAWAMLIGGFFAAGAAVRRGRALAPA